MELYMIDGNYVPGEFSGLRTVSGAEERAQRMMLKLKARRGGLLPMPDYGSRLHTLGFCRPGEREAAARQFIHEALAGEEAEIVKIECAEAAGGHYKIGLWLDISGRQQYIEVIA